MIHKVTSLFSFDFIEIPTFLNTKVFASMAQCTAEPMRAASAVERDDGASVGDSNSKRPVVHSRSSTL